MNISAHISKLFLKNDCIVLEGFGGFILQKSKGTIRDNNKFLPPSKVVSFNQYLKSNDPHILLNYPSPILTTSTLICASEGHLKILQKIDNLEIASW